MPTKTYDLYAFDNLAASVRTQVLDRERDVNVGDEWWSAATVESWQATLEGQGYRSTKILFSGFGSQGDGACFEATLDLALWLRTHRHAGKYCGLGRTVDEVTITIRQAGHYYHERSMEVAGSYDGGDDRVAQELDEVERLIDADATAISRHIYRDLQDRYLALTDDAAVAETLRANDVLFHQDGCRAHS